MAIAERPTKPFKMVLKNDPALYADSDSAMRAYLSDNDLSHFNIDVDKGIHNETGDKVTIIKALPLKREWYHLIDIGMSVSSLILLFKHHVLEMINIAGRDKIIVRDNEVSDEILDKIDIETIAEVAGVIVDIGKGADGVKRAFTSRDTSLVGRMRSRQLLARLANRENAKDTDNLSDSDQ